MQALKLPFSQGRVWLLDGLALWRRAPALLTYLTFGYLLTLLVLSVMPLIGTVLAALLMPVMSLGVMNGCRALDEGRKPGPDVLFSGFRAPLRPLLGVGALYFALSMLSLGITSLADGGLLFEIMTGQRAPDDTLEQNSGFLLALILGVIVSTPVTLAYWFAPILAGWYHLPPHKALFFSLVACWRNWPAFFSYALHVAGLCALLPMIVISVVALAVPPLASLLTLPLPLIILPILFASFYTNARDVFDRFRDAPR